MLSHCPSAFRTILRIQLILLFCAQIGTASVTNQFIRLTNYPTGGSPARIVSADFNRDGKADVVVLNSNGVLSSLPGTGAGAFAAPLTITTLPASSAGALMVAADFNGDGNPDVLLLAPPGNAVQVFLGHGNGTFAAPVSINDGLSAAGGLAMGDFNNDGRADIAVAGATSISILLGNGSGIFAAPKMTATGLTAPDSLALALGDVNRDSHLDAAVTDGNGNLQILLGDAGGTLHPQSVASFSTLFPPNVIAIADFNGDGKPDIAAGAGTNLPQFVFPQVCLFTGNGDGTFGADSLGCLSVGLDSVTEMVVTNLNGKPGLTFPSDPLMVYTNNGAGVLTPMNYATGGPLALADFNGDGRQDIASGSALGVQMLLNVGAGNVRAPLSISQAGGPFTFTIGMNTADMNSDGYADLVLDDFFDEHSFLLPTLDVLRGGPRNKFTRSTGVGPAFYQSISAQANQPAIGDFNHDGFLDIAYSAVSVLPSTGTGESQPFAQVFFGDGKGNLPAQGPELSFTSDYLIAGYFNAGGVEDLASLDAGSLEILIGNGDGTFAAPKTNAAGINPVFVLQRDLNGDGKRDLVVVNHDSNTISILLGNGDGTFKPQTTYAAGTSPNTAVTGDFNRDGKVDIAVGSKAGVSVLLGNGNGTFQAQKIYSATGPITGIAQASVRQDGIESLLGIDSANKRFTLLPGLGDGTFGTPAFYPVDQFPVAILAADFDRDGATDIVLLNEHEGTNFSTGQPIGGSLSVYYNQGGDHVALSNPGYLQRVGIPVHFTATVTAGPGEPGTPTGTVTFREDSIILKTVPLTAGSATILTYLPQGNHNIFVQYSGDANFNPNHSAKVNVYALP